MHVTNKRTFKELAVDHQSVLSINEHFLIGINLGKTTCECGVNPIVTINLLYIIVYYKQYKKTTILNQ